MPKRDQPPGAPRSAAGTSGPPNLADYRAVHGAIRTSNDRLVDALVRLNEAPNPASATALRRWFGGYSCELHRHHLIEDTIFFPALADRVPTYLEHRQTLEFDHERLEKLVALVSTSLARLTAARVAAKDDRSRVVDAAVELRDLMSAHLDFEDREILTLFERHFDADDYAILDARARRCVSFRHALFSVPWLMASLEPASAEKLQSEAPMSLRALHQLTRAGYARLAATALGRQPMISAPQR